MLTRSISLYQRGEHELFERIARFIHTTCLAARGLWDEWHKQFSSSCLALQEYDYHDPDNALCAELAAEYFLGHFVLS